MGLTDFENVKGQIGYCGIWCGSCVVGNGVLSEVARRYGKVTEAYGLREWGPKELDYDTFLKGLRAIQSLEACPGCRRGGGRDNCEIRACARAKGMPDCTECGENGQCNHAEIIGRMRSGALEAGLFVRAGEQDREQLLKQWMIDLASRWPCSMLFDDQW
jgi:hypothetical protein